MRLLDKNFAINAQRFADIMVSFNLKSFRKHFGHNSDPLSLEVVGTDRILSTTDRLEIRKADA